MRVVRRSRVVEVVEVEIEERPGRELLLRLEVLQEGEGAHTRFIARPESAIFAPKGYLELPIGRGATLEEAVDGAIDWYLEELRLLYPNDIPPWAFVPAGTPQTLVALQALEERSLREDAADWRMDLPRTGVKAGPYLEFQLETGEGGYARYSPDSLFVGSEIFAPTYAAFSRLGEPFDTWGLNVFPLRDLGPLKDRLQRRRAEIAAVDSLSAYLGTVQRFKPALQERGRPEWQERRDGVLEFLRLVIRLVGEAQNTGRAVYALGI